MVQLPPPGESTSTSTPSRPSLSSAQLPPGTGATHSLHFAPPSALFPPSSPRRTPLHSLLVRAPLQTLHSPLLHLTSPHRLQCRH